MAFTIDNIIKFLPFLTEITLHLKSLGKAEDMEKKLSEITKMVKNDNLKDIGKALVDFTGFADEALHSKAVRNIPPDRRKKYDELMAELAKKDEFGNPENWRHQEVHDNVIIFVATIEDEQERIEVVTELSKCETLEEFKILANSRGYDRPNTPVRQKLQKFYKIIRESTPVIAEGFKEIGTGVKNILAAITNATSEAFKDLDEDFNNPQGNDETLTWGQKQKRQYQQNQEGA